MISFTVNLNDGWEGGGTEFDFLKGDRVDDRVVVHGGEAGVWGSVSSEGSVVAKPGTLILHSGKMLHGGAKVTGGVRYVLVGFVDVDCTNRGLFDACKEWGRWDVLERRLKDLSETGGGRKVQGMGKYALGRSAIRTPWTRNVERERARLEVRLRGAIEARRKTEEWFLTEMEGGL